MAVRARINVLLNLDNEKDKTIYDFLNSKYKATDFIKSIMYDLAKGQTIQSSKQIEVKEVEEYDDIKEMKDMSESMF